MDEFALLRNVFGVEEHKAEAATAEAPQLNRGQLIIPKSAVIDLKDLPRATLVQKPPIGKTSQGVLRLFSDNGRCGVSLKLPGCDAIVLGTAGQHSFEAYRDEHEEPSDGPDRKFVPGEVHYRCYLTDFSIDLGRVAELLRNLAIQQQAIETLSRRSDPQLVQP